MRLSVRKRSTSGAPPSGGVPPQKAPQPPQRDEQKEPAKDDLQQSGSGQGAKVSQQVTRQGGRLFGEFSGGPRKVATEREVSSASRPKRTSETSVNSEGENAAAEDDENREDAFTTIDPDYACDYLEGLKNDIALQLEINRLELLASLVPARIIRHHMQNKSKPHGKSMRVFSSRFQAAVLFADISGFSTLAERLVKEINHVAQAAENLSRYIGASLEQMVAAITTRGGDVIKFAGDAILAVFPVEQFNNSLEAAALCCSYVAMELVEYDFTISRSRGNKPPQGTNKASNMRKASTVPGDAGSSIVDSSDAKTALTQGSRQRSDSGSVIRLYVHCGVGCGTVVSYHVGGLKDRWEYIVTGSPVDQVAKAEPEAKGGQTVVSQETYELLKSSLEGTVLPSGNLLLSQVNGGPFPRSEVPLINSELREFTRQNPLQYKRLQDLLQCYVPNPALLCIEGGNGIWAGELRVVSTMFCRLIGLRYEGKESDVNTVQDSFKVVHKHVVAYEGTLLRFIVDDKGASLLTGFGLPPQKHENDAVRAIKASMNIHEELEANRKNSSSKWKVDCSIGITTGEVFCGTVGGLLRCEYTLHGVKVNLAARLMVYNKRGYEVLCDSQTWAESKNTISYSKPKQIQVKGMNGLVDIYRPKQQKLVVTIGPNDQTRQVGRQSEETLVKRMLRNVMDPRNPVPATLIITGDAGMGKTRMCQYLLGKAKSRPFLTLVARGDDTEMHTPFFIWKSVLPQLLQYFVGSTKLSRLSEEERTVLLMQRVPEASALSLLRRGSADDGQLEGGDSLPVDGAEEKRGAKSASVRDLDGGTSRENLRPLYPLLRRVLPDFFKMGDGSAGHDNNADGSSEVQMINLAKLLIEIFRKAANDLKRADRYFDVSSNGIKENENVVRIVIVVEDVQWCDAYSMETLYRLAEKAEPICMMVTCRENDFGQQLLRTSSLEGSSGSRGSPPMGKADTAMDWYRKCKALQNSIQSELKPLKLVEIQECLQLWSHCQDKPIPQRLTHVIFEKSQGHPFFAYELYKLMLEDGVITVEDGVCKLTAKAQGEEFSLPGTISALMVARLDRIPASQQLTLKVASVIGTEFRMHVLAQVLLSYTGSEEMEESVLAENNPKASVKRPQRRKTTVAMLEDEDEEHMRRIASLRAKSAIKGSEANIEDNNDAGSKSPPRKAVPKTAAGAEGDVREISKLLDENISSLIDRGFLVQDTDSNKKSIIRFNSVMLRDSAYNLLLFKVRKAIHITVAQFYEDKYSDYLQPVYLRLANHYYNAEALNRSMYYLAIAGDDALEMHNMQAVWLCFSRLISISEKAPNVEPWKRASWYRKVGEAYMFFGQNKSAEEYLQNALVTISLDINGVRRSSGMDPEKKGGDPTRATSPGVVASDRSTSDANSKVGGATPHDVPSPSAPPTEHIAKLVKRQDSSQLESGPNLLVQGAAADQRSLDRNAYVASRVQLDAERRPSSAHSVLDEGECQSRGSGIGGFFKKILSSHSKKKEQQERDASVFLALKTYRRVEDAKGYEKVRQNSKSNVETFLEASKVYSLLGVLISDQRSPLGLERRLNAMNLAVAAHRCALKRPQKAPDRIYNGTNVSLDLDDHKIETREVDPCSASLDQLCLSYASASIFYIGMGKPWAKEIAQDYINKTLDLLPQVRASSTKGNVTFQLGEYMVLTGNFADAEQYLRKSTWVFNFLQFHRSKMESIELHITLELFKGASMSSPVVGLARSLFQDGVGIVHVNSLCAYVELLNSGYSNVIAYLQQTLEHSLAFLHAVTPVALESTDGERYRDLLYSISRFSAEAYVPDGLIVLSLLMLRRFGLRDAALQMVEIAARIAKTLNYEHLPIVRFHLLVGIFKVHMESFSDYSEDTRPREGSQFSDASDDDRSDFRSEFDDGTSSHASGRYSRHRSKYSKTSKGRLSRSFRGLLRQPTASKGLTRDTQQQNTKGDTASVTIWKKIAKAAASRKTALPGLRDLLDIIQSYAEAYDVCKPFASYCEAVFHSVKHGKVTSKAHEFLQRAAEQAHEKGMLYLKYSCLLELGISREEPKVLASLEDKLKKISANFELRRARAEMDRLEK